MSGYPPNSNSYTYPAYTASQGGFASSAPSGTTSSYGGGLPTAGSTYASYGYTYAVAPTGSPYGDPQPNAQNQLIGSYTSYAPTPQSTGATTSATSAYPYNTAATSYASSAVPTPQSPYISSTSAPGTRSVAALAARFGQSTVAVPKAYPGAPANHRPLYILSFPSAMFKSHWAIWFPMAGGAKFLGEKVRGTLIHATGDLRTGFKIEFQRGSYGPASTRGPYSAILGYVNDQWLTDGPMDRGDMNAYNAVEQLALSIPAPEASLNSAQDQASGKRPELRDCQWWLKQYIAQLISRGMLSGEAWTVVENTPIQYR